MNFVEMYVEVRSMKESETVSDTNDMTDSVSVTESESVKIEE